MALIGYARVSTAEQDTVLQTDALPCNPAVPPTPEIRRNRLLQMTKLLASGVRPKDMAKNLVRVRSNVLPLDAHLIARLAYDFFRFLKRSQLRDG